MPGGRRGFTLLEVTVVLVVAAVILALGTTTFSHYNQRLAAMRAAQVFSLDLALARSTAVRGRERVAIRFFEGSKYYLVATESGRELATRRFGTGADFTLSAVNLAEAGDTLSFSSRGFVTLAGTTGTATFTSGDEAYVVTFNAMGASKVAGS